LVEFGYNRDGKKGHEQIVIGLICNKEGCPVGVEVYRGNTKDGTTVVDKIQEIKQFYGIKKVVFVGDRGMVTKHNLEALKDEEGLHTITALTRADINKLLERELPGISGQLRSYGQERTRYSMLSRGVAGTRGMTLIINLPGSPGGVRDALDVLPQLTGFDLVLTDPPYGIGIAKKGAVGSNTTTKREKAF